MTKEDTEKYIYDKIIEIAVNKHLEGEDYRKTIFNDMENYLKKEKKWCVRTTKDFDTGYYSIELTSCNNTSDRMPDS